MDHKKRNKKRIEGRIKGLYLVTDTAIQSRFGHEELVDMAIKAGGQVVQLRDKYSGSGPLLRTAKQVAERCRRAGVCSIINDRADIAMAAGADGVHLGQNDLPVDVVRSMVGAKMIIGGTASTIDEALHAERLGADYVGFGHIFDTSTKVKKYQPRGLQLLEELRSALSIPVVAIGGIRQNNITQVIETGADAVAVCSAVCTAEDPFQAARNLLKHFPVDLSG